MEEIPWVPNASVTTVEYSDGGCRLVMAGDASFLKDDVS